MFDGIAEHDVAERNCFFFFFFFMKLLIFLLVSF